MRLLQQTEDQMMSCKIFTRKIYASLGSSALNAVSAVLLLVLLYWRVFESMEPTDMSYLTFLTGN